MTTTKNGGLVDLIPISAEYLSEGENVPGAAVLLEFRDFQRDNENWRHLVHTMHLQGHRPADVSDTLFSFLRMVRNRVTGEDVTGLPQLWWEVKP